MSIFDDFETNKEKEQQGVAIEYSANKDGTVPTFFVSRMSRTNKKYVKSLEQNSKPYRRQIELETLKPEVAEKVNIQVFVDSILNGWQNIQDKNGAVIEYSKAAAIELFKKLPDLYDDLAARAAKASTFRDDALQEEAKN